MKTIYQILFICLMTAPLHAQLYFPPTNSSTWETTDPSTLGWCQPKIDSLYHFLEANSTKAFILLKDGKIVLEKYFSGHSATNNWYWASAGKTLTSTLVGLAQQDNKLNISDLSSKYLGSGWTSCTPTQENKITIRHQLTMTSGLNDALADPYCTTNTCLQYKADAGTRWAYHNAPYTLLDKVIENATGSTLNQYINQKLKTTIGMDGIFLKQDFNNVYYSTAR
ncbi:MAG TPA: serine hydrolase domain-containing protein, partial [Saprospiraceae bacterium]|nr:serine hydrolase domain-containing protein [Saprospiraceae bacterium]